MHSSNVVDLGTIHNDLILINKITVGETNLSTFDCFNCIMYCYVFTSL